MNVSVVLNEGMYASWIRGNFTVPYVNPRLKINLIKTTKRLIKIESFKTDAE